MRPSFALTSRPLHNEGAVLPQEGSRECRAPDAPAALRAKVESTQASHHGHAGSPGIPRAMVLTVSSVLSLVTGLSCHHHQRNLFRQFDASVGASGPHGFAVRAQCHSSFDIAHVHRIPPRVRDDREPPLQWDETARKREVICVGRKQKYFCKKDWTRQANHFFRFLSWPGFVPAIHVLLRR
jgi:hypothetical protein